MINDSLAPKSGRHGDRARVVSWSRPPQAGAHVALLPGTLRRSVMSERYCPSSRSGHSWRPPRAVPPERVIIDHDGAGWDVESARRRARRRPPLPDTVRVVPLSGPTSSRRSIVVFREGPGWRMSSPAWSSTASSGHAGSTSGSGSGAPQDSAKGVAGEHAGDSARSEFPLCIRAVTLSDVETAPPISWTKGSGHGQKSCGSGRDGHGQHGRNRHDCWGRGEVVMSRIRTLETRILIRSAAYAGAITMLVALTEAGKKWA